MKLQNTWILARRIALDGILLAGCFIAAVLLHHGGSLTETDRAALPLGLCVGVSVMLAGMAWARAYRKLTDFVSVGDFLGVLRGTFFASLVLLVANVLAPPAVAWPWAVVLRFFGLAAMTMSLALFTLRIWRESPLGHVRKSDGARRAILVYGAGRAGSAVAREILSSPELGYVLQGFVDDDATKWGKEIHGGRVLGGRHELARIVGPLVRDVVLAIPSLDPAERREILSHCRRAGAHVRIVPGLAELLRGGSFVHQIRDVRVEDLLAREAVELDETEVREQLAGETVLVTGAAGSIGSEVCQQILRHEPRQLLLVEQSESRLYYLEMDLQRKQTSTATQLIPLVADISDRERMESILRRYRPSHIFHAAAYKHVPMMERNPHEAIRNNVFGTYVVAQLARQYHVGRFVLVSTDKAVEPTSVMGATKRGAELLVRELQHGSQTRFCAVRFGNVLDSDGSVVPLFKKQIAAGGPITITHPDMERFFMTIPEAARLIVQASTLARGGEVFVLEMGQPVKILDLARSLVELSGLRFLEDIQVEFTGMRPGEKLTEKLFFEHERNLATRSRQIHSTQLETGRRLDIEDLLRSLSLLLRTAADEKDLGSRFMALMASLESNASPAAAPARATRTPAPVVPLQQVASSKG